MTHEFLKLLVLIFVIGLTENFLLSLESKFLQRGRRLTCAIIGYINILIYFRIFQAMMDNINNRIFEHVYALAFAVGVYVAITFDSYINNLAKSKGFKKFKRNFLKRKRGKRL